MYESYVWIIWYEWYDAQKTYWILRLEYARYKKNPEEDAFHIGRNSYRPCAAARYFVFEGSNAYIQWSCIADDTINDKVIYG